MRSSIFDFWTDVKFPDEVETPIDVPARVRFAKYRGLKSFRSSPWDPKESLPLDYSYVFQLSNYTMLQKSETTRAEALSTALQKSRTGDMEDAKRRNKNKKANKKSNSKNQSKKNQSKKQGKTNGNDGNNGMEVEDMGDDDGK